ncbi:MAG: alpha-ketoglutarate-dependent dioxygenase AlkB [Natronospirillum sp.]|uniref:alpha-ketoglutarate-dependent dioxygenase AlkB family protein n=1 Tax=Natronospirillum sp. TaxID=2812955 RepID=UPI0026011EEF|nr:alpha-ketoglutarate-dependent dioxygenase AlkB [Natronospirillum sp.]MCH8553384.1 alpha-ketoglutarate-dependent dioxygenase AlkB [Natronospirillum sp.]
MADYLTVAAADKLFSHCLSCLPWKQEAIRLFGKPVLQPRLQVWMGDAGARYRYSGTWFSPEPWTAELHQLARRLSEQVGAPLNSVLCNRYVDGEHSMGWHADDEPELGPAPVIASVSLGASRRFRLRQRKAWCTGHERRSMGLDLGHGDLLVMRGDTQRYWEHSLPKTRKRVGERINLTFRHVDPELVRGQLS